MRGGNQEERERGGTRERYKPLLTNNIRTKTISIIFQLGSTISREISVRLISHGVQCKTLTKQSCVPNVLHTLGVLSKAPYLFLFILLLFLLLSLSSVVLPTLGM